MLYLDTMCLLCNKSIIVSRKQCPAKNGLHTSGVFGKTLFAREIGGTIIDINKKEYGRKMDTELLALFRSVYIPWPMDAR